jgi:hypothetical protein
MGFRPPLLRSQWGVRQQQAWGSEELRAKPTTVVSSAAAMNLPFVLQQMSAPGFYTPRPSPIYPLYQPSTRYNNDLEKERMVDLERPGRWEGDA